MNTPAEIASNYLAIGKGKVAAPLHKMIVLAILGGAFIGFGGVGATMVAISIPEASLGKFLGACVFPSGLAMVLLAGSELFTGNCLLAIPLLQKEIKITGLLRNWIAVYIGNMIGGFLVAASIVFGHQISSFGNGMAISVISTAVTKCSLSFSDAFIRGIACNFLVCIAIWMSFAAKDVAGKVAALFFPVMVFVLCGFEHSVANMYFIGAGLFAKLDPTYLNAALEAGVDTSALTLGNFFITNLLPVTLGNIVGGALCVGLPYWFLFLKKSKNTDTISEGEHNEQTISDFI